jgi:hypothetical protein
MANQVKAKHKQIKDLKSDLEEADEAIAELREEAHKHETIIAELKADKLVIPAQAVIEEQAKTVKHGTVKVVYKINGDVEIPTDEIGYCPARVAKAPNGKPSCSWWQVCGCQNDMANDQVYCDKHQNAFRAKGWLRDGDSMVSGEGSMGADLSERFNEKQESWGKAREIGELKDTRPPVIQKLYPLSASGTQENTEEVEWDKLWSAHELTVKGNKRSVWVPHLVGDEVEVAHIQEQIVAEKSESDEDMEMEGEFEIGQFITGFLLKDEEGNDTCDFCAHITELFGSGDGDFFKAQVLPDMNSPLEDSMGWATFSYEGDEETLIELDYEMDGIHYKWSS